MSESEQDSTSIKSRTPRIRRLPPHDSWITLGPGQSVELDATNANEWQKQTRAFREIRGNILSACFSIEFALDRLISEVFFPGVDTPASTDYKDEQLRELRDVFDDLFLKNRLRFEAKIQIVNSIRKKLTVVGKILDPGLIARLNQLRDIRNRFAHYPVSFFPDPSGHVLTARLVCRDRDIILDQAYFDKVDEDFRSVQDDLQKVITTLRGETADPSLGINRAKDRPKQTSR